jgi:hypothetical protein
MSTRVGAAGGAGEGRGLARQNGLRDFAELVGRALLISLVVGVLLTLAAAALP